MEIASMPPNRVSAIFKGDRGFLLSGDGTLRKMSLFGSLLDHPILTLLAAVLFGAMVFGDFFS
jgi:hypothetical protein